MAYWEPDLEPVPPGQVPARQIINLDRDFVKDPNFPDRSMASWGRWIPDGIKRKAENSWSDFRHLPVLELPNEEWEGKFGSMCGEVRPKSKAVLPPRAPPPPKQPPPSLQEAPPPPPPPPKGPPTGNAKAPPVQVAPAVKAASTDIRVGQEGISMVVRAPKRRSSPEGTGGSSSAVGAPGGRDSGGEERPSEGPGGSSLCRGIPGRRWRQSGK